MSNVPMLLHIINELEERQPSFYQSLGMGVHPHHVLHRQHEPLLRSPLVERHLNSHVKSKRGKLANVGKDGFQVCMEVGQFKPNELSVKVVDRCVVVEGKHEEREDEHGFISRQFVRRYSLPKGYEPEKVACTMSSDGVLTVSVPNPAHTEKLNECVVQIQQVGPAHLNVKNSPEKPAVEDERGDA